MDSRPRRAYVSPVMRRVAVLAAGLMLGVLVSPPAAVTRTDAPEGCVSATRHTTLYAEQLPSDNGKIRIGYGLTPGGASIPGPTIEMVEGECLQITLVNDVPRATLEALRDDPFFGSKDPNMPIGVSLHVHGVKYTQASDGTVHTDSWVPPGQSRTYTWYAAPRVFAAGRVVSVGTAGYWWYHDHIVGTTHGTGGLESGLFGGLVVRRPGDITPDRTYVVGMGPNATLNLKHYPDCPNAPTLQDASNTCFVARKGELVEFLVIGIGDDFHTFHLHGHNWADTRTGFPAHQLDDTQVIDNKTVGPADSFGFIIRAGEEVGHGSWMMHCHVQGHSDRGMATFLHVLPPPGSPAPAPSSLPMHHGGHSHG